MPGPDPEEAYEIAQPTSSLDYMQPAQRTKRIAFAGIVDDITTIYTPFIPL
jgi:hypothetical protein